MTSSSTLALVKPEVLIIGSGVVGMSLAAELSQRGVRVAIIDKGDPGHGCSYGNAGWITPCFAMPLPMPGMLFKSMKWLLNPDGPLYIKPEPSWLLMRWMTRFLLAMNQKQMTESVAALTAISKYSLDAYRKYHEQTPGGFGFEQKGLLMVAQTQAGVRDTVREMELVASHGIPGQYLDPQQIRELEPALTGRLEGGVYFPTEAHAEPLAVVRALTDLAVKNGAMVLPRTEVYDFDIQGGLVKGVHTTRGYLAAEKFVLATGSWSHGIARTLGLNVPVMGGKGYALIVKPFDPAPRIPIMCLEKKIAVTPRAGTIRLAGTLELVDRDDGITPRRVRAIVRGAREFMNVPEQPEVTEIWRGLRPCTPDGVPLVGATARYSNLYLNTGHQMLGLQSAPGTARLAADLLTGATPLFDPHPFRPTRF